MLFRLRASGLQASDHCLLTALADFEVGHPFERNMNAHYPRGITEG